MDLVETQPFVGCSGFPRMRGDGPVVWCVDERGVVFPPHARGWTAFGKAGVGPVRVSPACAGMDPLLRPVHSGDPGFPRMRGDGPPPQACPFRRPWFPPHARGWTARRSGRQRIGVRFPRMRGDGPFHRHGRPDIPRFPPHARGWTPQPPTRTRQHLVSPACAGMDPAGDRLPGGANCFPRMRGDGPHPTTHSGRPTWFPPHARGWTLQALLVDHAVQVSPACAGMDLLGPFRQVSSRCFPRMRGDGPLPHRRLFPVAAFPPHARGWTRSRVVGGRRGPVSPACAGMDRTTATVSSWSPSFPRMRGDGPSPRLTLAAGLPFPSHARGWTVFRQHECPSHLVSPACAGMDRHAGWEAVLSTCFPRMRGDGPVTMARVPTPESFPPHARGWTHLRIGWCRPSPVSPACAGMDRGTKTRSRRGCSFPRMRGDGPF